MQNVGDVRVLFVCLGNICRSPTAHGVFAHKVRQAGLEHRVQVDSCGTGHWHVGNPPDRRATQAAAERGYDLRPLRARQVCAEDFARFHYILAMDEENLANLHRMRPDDFAGHLGLFLDFYPAAGLREVPDPYYGADDGFATVLDLVEAASEGLLQEIAGAGPPR
jgi:protein-tyrosine phosphatase